MNSAQYRFIGSVALFGLWGLLVAFKGAPVDPLINGIQAALIGLGVFHVAKSPSEGSK